MKSVAAQGGEPEISENALYAWREGNDRTNGTGFVGGGNLATKNAEPESVTAFRYGICRKNMKY